VRAHTHTHTHCVDVSRLYTPTINEPYIIVGPRMLLSELSASHLGTRYMVVDCGGGTVDITVHELSEYHGTLRELHKATGGPWGSMGK
jgi:hypothetical protein